VIVKLNSCLNPWLLLLAAGVLEVGWALGLKYTQGFTRALPSLLTIVALIASLALLALALRELPIGTAYAVWTGIGVIGTTVVGMLCFGEPFQLQRIACLLLIAGGIVGLKLGH
jgi:quaternary ammonium compound-resistance protein SugE